MTKKHFEEIAHRFLVAIKWTEDPAAKKALVDMAKELGRTFYGFNNRFDYNRFLKACGVEA